VLLKARNIIVKIVPENSRLFKYLTLVGLKLNAKSQHKKLGYLRMSVHAAHHCNLNCKCCTAFSPIADEYFLDIQSYQKDMSRLAELSGGKMSSFNVSGGEPLLHPKITEIFNIARSYFPEAEITFMTNGVLLPQMTESFWENCKENRVSICISKYPINLNVEEIVKMTRKYGTQYNYVGGVDVPIKSMWKYPLDLKGRQTLSRSYKLCSQINICFSMDNGVIYPCNPIAKAKYFNKYFGTNLEVVKGDTLDLYMVKSIDDVYDFLCKPKPFCRYCNRRDLHLGIKYGSSKRDIGEWT
jgi:MoaA/NifB/PqqE/SkfB family radical SAM enzyme